MNDIRKEGNQLLGSDMVWICVGTPSGVDGEADLKYVEAAATSIAEIMTEPRLDLHILDTASEVVPTEEALSMAQRRTQCRGSSWTPGVPRQVLTPHSDL